MAQPSPLHVAPITAAAPFKVTLHAYSFRGGRHYDPYIYPLPIVPLPEDTHDLDYFEPGEIMIISETVRGAYFDPSYRELMPYNFLRLANGRGWLFELQSEQHLRVP